MNGYEVSGEDLYRRYLIGDAAAFEQIIELYGRELTNFLYTYIKDYGEAKNLMIETFAQLTVSKGQFAGKSSIKTYIFTIGKNLALKEIKTRRKNQHVAYDDIAETAIGTDSFETKIELDEMKKYLHDAMGSLKDEYRTVLEILYFNGMNYREAGMLMVKNEKQITNLAYRAKRALKKELESSVKFMEAYV